MRRRRLWIVALLAALLAIACLGAFGSIAVTFPPNQGPRVDGGDVVGIETGGAFAWVVPTATGVVLIDAGIDPAAEALRAEIGDRAVRAVLLTHGHYDHVAGLAAFPDAPAWIGPGDAAYARGERKPQGTMPWLFSTLMGEPHDFRLGTLEDGVVLDIDGERFTVVLTPGHTPGSAMFVWRDVLFTGDSLFGFADRVGTPHPAFSDDPALNRATIRKVAPHRFDRIADGHGGLTSGARAKIEAFLAH